MKIAGRARIVQVHRWVGLILGLLTFSMCVTGSLLVFDKEITEALDGNSLVAGRPSSLTLLEREISAQLEPESRLTGIDLNCNRVGIETGEESFTYYYDPDTFRLTARGNQTMEWILQLHRNLLLGSKGRGLILVTALSVLFLLLTGLKLWWPRNSSALRQALTVKRKVSRRLFILDLHRVGGFYSLIPLALIAFTGLGFSLYKNEFRDAIVWLCGDPAPTKSRVAGRKPLDLDQALEVAQGKFPGADPTQVLISRVNPQYVTFRFKQPGQPGVYGRSAVHLDLSNGNLEFIDSNNFKAGRRITKLWLLPLHRGRMFGLPHQILWLMVALVGACLPVSGFWLWFRSRRKR